MLPRELIEKLVGGYSATGLHIVVTSTDGIEGFLIVQTLPLEVVGQGVVEGISRAPAPSARILLKLSQSLRLDGQRLHTL